MTVKVFKTGPGTLSIGDVATAVDLSCQITNGEIRPDKDKDDDVVTLCGDTAAGATTYRATLAGTVLQDLGEATGFVAFCWDPTVYGTAQPFTFTPNTAAGDTWTGTVIVDPIKVGGDVDANADADFEFDCVGMPVLGAGV